MLSFRSRHSVFYKVGQSFVVILHIFILYRMDHEPRHIAEKQGGKQGSFPSGDDVFRLQIYEKFSD